MYGWPPFLLCSPFSEELLEKVFTYGAHPVSRSLSLSLKHLSGISLPSPLPLLGNLLSQRNCYLLMVPILLVGVSSLVLLILSLRSIFPLPSLSSELQILP